MDKKSLFYRNRVLKESISALAEEAGIDPSTCVSIIRDHERMFPHDVKEAGLIALEQPKVPRGGYGVYRGLELTPLTERMLELWARGPKKTIRPGRGGRPKKYDDDMLQAVLDVHEERDQWGRRVTLQTISEKLGINHDILVCTLGDYRNRKKGKFRYWPKKRVLIPEQANG